MRITYCLAAVLAATMGATAVAVAQTGNGAPSGAHYSLNIVGVPRAKKNGTDGEASFSLPAPGGYTVWARALGKPGGQAKITTCAMDIVITDPAEICSTQNEVFVRDKGKSSFRNVTDALTTIVLDPIANADAVTACGGTTVSLFDPCLQGFFWEYDNNGLKLLQVRFYQNAP